MKGWERAKQIAERCSGGEYVSLKNDGDKVVGVFCDEPNARELHWVEGAYVECAETGCPHCARGVRVAMKAQMNFYVLAERKMKKIEGGAEWFKSLETAKDKYGLVGNAFEVKRHGKAGDQKTKYSILYDRKLEPEEAKMVAAAPLHELGSHDSDDAVDASLPRPVFDELKARLQKLGKTVGNTFLGHFGAERLSDLKGSDEKRARALLAELEAPAAAAESTSEIDPFS